MTDRHVAVIGAGITGAAAAHHLATRHSARLSVTLFEQDDQTGGKLRATPFAGLDHIDEAADAFLARLPDAVGLAHEVGLGDDLVSPEPVGAAVWFNRLHPIPSGLILGVPGDLISLARTPLFSWTGKARAALEPLLPRRSLGHDSLGLHIRARFGNEVHERLVDALVGSIYAADTDYFSLAEVPQIAALAEQRSLLLAALRQQRNTEVAATTGTGTGAAAAVFAAPRAGVAALVAATLGAATDAGATIRTGIAANVGRDGDRWRVAGEVFDAVILSGSATVAAHALEPIAGDERLDAALSARAPSTDVAMVSLHVNKGEWPDHLQGISGYLVPKPMQQDVTAVSFASQKWAHWQPPSGGQIVRVSLGRQGAPILHLDDDEIVERALGGLQQHLGASLTPDEIRVSRWAGAFSQYRPHHRRWVDELRAALPDGIEVAGSGYDGMGVPACVKSGKASAERAAGHALALQG